MYSHNPTENQFSRRNLLVGGVSLATAGAISMVQGCGSESGTVVNTQTGSNGLPGGGNNPGPAPGPVPPAFVQFPVQKSAFGILDTTLTVAFATNVIGPQTVNTRTYNGILGGPTLRVRPGDTLRINVVNNLPVNVPPGVPANINTPHQFNTTNLHTHGLHVSPSGNSDNIFVEIPPAPQSNSFQYEYQIPANHPPGTLWYHPHKHGSSSLQLFSGMAGALIIEGGIDALPEIAAARDLVYLIQELNITPANPGLVPDFGPGQAFPQGQRKLLVNGQELPTLQAFSGEVIRLRVINACVRTTVPFSIVGHTLNIIALDGLNLATTRQAASISIPPAGRADIMIRCGAPGNYNVVKGQDNSIGNNDAPQNIGQLTVLNTVVNMALPTTLLPSPTPISRTRTATLYPFATSPLTRPPTTAGNQLASRISPSTWPISIPTSSIRASSWAPWRSGCSPTVAPMAIPFTSTSTHLKWWRSMVWLCLRRSGMTPSTYRPTVRSESGIALKISPGSLSSTATFCPTKTWV